MRSTLQTTEHISPSQAQIRLFWVYLHVLEGTDAQTLKQRKEAIVREYTQGRSDSLREISSNELGTFFDDYKDAFERKHARTQAMRNKVVWLLMQQGYIRTQIWKEAYAIANDICLRRFKKALQQMYYNDLPSIISVIETKWSRREKLK